jgi:hypothetical protein
MKPIEEVLLDALRQAVAFGAEMRLYRSGKLDGLFARHGGADLEAATRAIREGLLEIVRTETRGKTASEWVRATPRAIDYLHEQESPLRALRDLRETLAANREAVPAWLADMRSALGALEQRLAEDAGRWVQRLEALTRRVEQTLERLERTLPVVPEEITAAHPWALDAVQYLDRRKTSGAPGECPLPELFAALCGLHVGLSVGAFHEGLRVLHERRVLKLLPPASPDEVPRPEFALLDGATMLYLAAR